MFSLLLVNCLLGQLLNKCFFLPVLKQSILFLVSERCHISEVKFSDINDGRSPNLVCDVNEALQRIELVNNQKIRFKCCETSRKCKHSTSSNHLPNSGGWGADILYRQVIQCFNDDFITDLHFTRNNSLNQICYIYKCCNRSGENKTCYPSRSSSNQVVKALYLKGKPIFCQHGYGLTNIHIFGNDKGEYQNNYSCTKTSTSWTKQGKKQLQIYYSV